ncbi:MAG: DUF5050 domain-containing protein [Paludibacteraceae bacterium]
MKKSLLFQTARRSTTMAGLLAIFLSCFESINAQTGAAAFTARTHTNIETILHNGVNSGDIKGIPLEHAGVIPPANTAVSLNPLQTVYWPNYEEDKIESISISGSNRSTIVSIPSTMDPISIEVDAENGKVYWFGQTDYKIHRANTDGSNIEIFISDPGYATNLFLDRKNGYLYWPNYEAKKIERIKTDGSSRADVVTTPEPISITVDITGQKIYWLDQSDYKIHRANTDGSGAEVFYLRPRLCHHIIFRSNK